MEASPPSGLGAGGGDDSAEDALTIEIDVVQAAAIAAVHEMLQRPLPPEAEAPRLEALLAASGAPLRLEADRIKGRRLVATRRIAAGETLFEEDATAWFLARSPGCDGVFSMAAPDGTLLATLPPWHGLRLLRDTLSFPREEHAAQPELGYALLVQLVCGDPVDGNFGSAAAGVPDVAPGISPGDGTNAVSARTQLLAQIAQCNAFSAALPEEDSAWKRALLWPALGRIVDPADRDILFDDPAPLSAISAFFVLGGLFNHSCAPNVRYTECAWAEGAPAPRVRFTAGRDISEGEEAVHAYLDPEQPVDERRRALLLTYGFVCRCERCVDDVAAASADEVGAGSGAGGAGCVDAFAAAGHFPNGNAARARAAFFAGGGHYPVVALPLGGDSEGGDMD